MSEEQPAQVQPQRSLWSELNELYGAMPPRRRLQLSLVLGLMILSALAEFATIGAVLPFLSLLADQDGSLPRLLGVFDRLGATSAGDRLIAATLLFTVLVAAAGAIRLLLASTTQGFAFGLGHDLSVEIHRRMLLQPYSFHITSNSSELITGLDKVASMVWNVLLQLMMAATAAFISAAIVIALVYIEPFAALAGVAAFAMIYLLISAFARRTLARHSAVIGSTWSERVKIVQESLGGIRDVIIDGSQALYVELLRRADRKFTRAKVGTAIIGIAPRYLLETAGTILIALIALMVAQREGGLAAALPVLGALALGAQRLLPLLQQIYQGWSLATGHRSVLTQVLRLLLLPLPEDSARRVDVAPWPLRNRISFEGVGFSYPLSRSPALHDVTLEICRGSTVALIGRTGSGKSTLADLIMGLIEPTAGRILIDGVPLAGDLRRRWQRGIAHVPQAIFLSDASIARNIAFGVPAEAVDMARVRDATNKAQLGDFVESLPDGFETRVGERGIRLSGGQRQRLGIARALYKQAQLLVLDEATSALDLQTEEAVMAALAELAKRGMTIISIAHRHSPAMRYDAVVRLEHGRVVTASDDSRIPRIGSS